MSTPRLTFIGRVLAIVAGLLVASVFALIYLADAGLAFRGWQYVAAMMTIIVVGIGIWGAVFKPDLDL